MEQIDNLATHVENSNLKVGNRVRSATGLPAVSAVTQLLIDANSNLATSAAVTTSQPTVTGEVINMTGTGAAGILTQTFVKGSDVTTFTTTGYVRVLLTDAGGQITNGYHYVRIGTLS